MRIKIIEVNNLENVTPKYQTWFKLQEDVVFVSVIHPEKSNRKSHLRRKSKPKTNENKKDNELCFWHSDWQFSKIENEYGLVKSGTKTYEITVNFDNEIHRIDSVVKNVAIEFQHTLTVSTNEIESRYIAHKALGYTPYLVLDFSEYSTKTILDIPNLIYGKVDSYIPTCNENTSQILKKLRKWLHSKYFLNKNLFLDFKEFMIRLTPHCTNPYYTYDRGFFIKNLLSLEMVLKRAEESTMQQIAERKEQEEIRIQQNDQTKSN